jgi:hypothetical protein
VKALVYEKQNVADYVTIKAALFEEYYDLQQNTAALMHQSIPNRTKERNKLLHDIRTNLLIISNLGHGSYNITEQTDKAIQTTLQNVNQAIQRYEVETFKTTRTNIVNTAKKISIDMRETGFLDTRIDNEKKTIDSPDYDKDIPEILQT